MVEQAQSIAQDLVVDYMNRPIARDSVDIFVPAGKIDDPKMKVTEKVQIEEGSYVLTDADPAFEDIRRVDMVNGVV